MYLAFRSYVIISAFTLNGSCNTLQEAVSTLPTPFSVANPTPANNSSLDRAQTSLLSYLDLSDCSALDVPSQLTPINNSTLPGPTTASPLPSATSSSATLPQPSKPHPRLDKKAKVIIILTTTVPVSALILLGIFACRKKRRSRSTAAKNANKTSSPSPSPDDTLPYLQKKPELEAESRAKYELEAHQRMYEILGEGAVCEIANGEVRRIFPRLQELRGAEHSVELET